MALIDELHRACDALQPDLVKVERLMRQAKVGHIAVGCRCFERRAGLAGGVDVLPLPRRMWRDPALVRRLQVDGGLDS